MAVDITQHSRLRFATLLTDGGVEYWDTLDLPTIVVQSNDLKYSTIASDRLDTLAYKFYGDPTLWWILAAANDMELTPTALNEGQLLTIPSPEYVLQVLFR